MNYAAQRRDPKRTAFGLTIAVLVHLLLIYALFAGLGHKMMDVIKGPLETQIIPQAKTQPPPPPPPQQLKLVVPPPPFIPPPIVQIAPTPAPTTAISAPPTPAPAAPVPFTPPAPAVSAVPDSDVSEVPLDHSTPVYPQQMLDDERQGSALVECTVGTDGRTSGCALLDTKGGAAFGVSALQFAETRTYRPAMHNGVAIEKRKRWNLLFSLN